MPVRKGDTIAKIAADRGHRDLARVIADENSVRSVNSVFSGRGKKRIKVPGILRQSWSFHVLAGDNPPRIVDGYAKLTTVDRPERVGLTVFEGYNPVVMEVPVRFESSRGSNRGMDIEADIALLERMAGRGMGADAIGPPPVVKVTVTNGASVVPLIPHNYQRSDQNKSGPLWRIANIEWDDSTGSGVLRNHAGNRVRQLAVVTLHQHTKLNLLSRSATVRARSKPPARKKKKARR